MDEQNRQIKILQDEIQNLKQQVEFYKSLHIEYIYQKAKKFEFQPNKIQYRTLKIREDYD